MSKGVRISRPTEYELPDLSRHQASENLRRIANDTRASVGATENTELDSGRTGKVKLYDSKQIVYRDPEFEKLLAYWRGERE